MNGEPDFNVKITVRNARLLRLIRQKFGTAAELSRRSGVTPTTIAALMTMRHRPILQSGEWRDAALNVAGALGVDPSEIWPLHLRERKVKIATAEMELSSDQVVALMAPAEDSADIIERKEIVSKLLECLPERVRYVVEERMKGADLGDLGREFGVTRGRIMQLELRGHRKMKERAKAMGLLRTAKAPA
jgi:lambda repressor-like predicted transcriptional regulator